MINARGPVPDEVVFASFGYLYQPSGPGHATITLDIRHRLYDPHVEPELRELTGKDKPVRDRVLGAACAEQLVSSLAALALPMRVEGRPLVIAIGCTDGRRRSVVVADEAAAILGNLGLSVRVIHHDIDKPVARRERKVIT